MGGRPMSMAKLAKTDGSIDAGGAARPVKISCRNVWKVYGDDPGGFFTDGDGKVADADGLLQRIRDGGHITAAADVSFDVHVGEVFVIMGLSGSGKSTMVRCLSRLVEPTAGEVLFDGRDLLRVSKEELIEIRRHKLGMVFQNFGLLPHLSVLDNIAFPLKVQGIDETERRRRAREVVELVGLAGREDAYPRELSGGQQQRVGIARSLVVEPELWFLDEPFSALDPLIRRQMQDEFLRLQRMLHKTIVFITHDFLEALRIADRIAIMKDGQVVQLGSPADIVLHPATDYVAEFTEDVPLVRVIQVADILEPATAELTAPGSAPGTPQQEVRPEMTLEEIMPHFALHGSGLAVTGPDGAIIGQVTPRGVVKALAAGEQRTSA